MLDLGCGPSGVLEVLSERAGPAGRVVGLDMRATSAFACAEGARVRDVHVYALVPVGVAEMRPLPVRYPDRRMVVDLVHP